MKKRFTLAIGLLGLSGVTYFGIGLYRAYSIFETEDSIHASFYPVIMALDRYCDDHGYAPESLCDLNPTYIEALPSSERVSEISYRRTPDKPEWRLTLASMDTGSRRLYIAEHGMPLSDEERKLRIIQYHERWSVLQPRKAESSPRE